ncbi:NAD(P)-binding domain-containing protein [Puia sp.]|jgi:pyrroline-5-carboxylate reductase|uniref:NAD(P)-binding domain-containing protein n=1 Tax=Puia sp. TaxID=2045100 RepID=UPI002F4147E2
MKIGFIGIGKIASAIVQGLCTSEAEGLEIFLSPRSEAASKTLAARYANVSRLATNQEVVDASDIVILAVRPPVAKEVLGALRFRVEQTVVSLVALLPYGPLRELTQPAAVVCRAIPLPTVVQHNCPIPLFDADERVTRLFSYLGETLPVTDEAGLHALWTLTGLITPYYDLLRGLSEWTIAHGVQPETANAYVANLFQSLSFLAQHSRPIDFGDLAKHAATPGGINEQAGKELTAAAAHTAWTTAADHVLQRFG